MTTKTYIATIVVGIIVGILLSWGWSAAKAATVIPVGVEVVGAQRVGIYTLYKVADHDNGAVCYTLGTGISCLATSTHE